MKKFSFISSVLLLTAVVVFLLIGCQKETSSSEEPTSVTSDNTPIKAVASGGNYAGTISNNYADALRKNYISKFSDDDNDRKLALQVAFSAKDLAAFISALQAKNNADIIYVNFGVYGRGAPALDSKNNGRLTVFFTGNSNLSVKTNGVSDAQSDEQSLNHGQIFP